MINNDVTDAVVSDAVVSFNTRAKSKARGWEHLSDKRREARKSECVHRIGPIPREDIAGGGESIDIGTLDSDMEDENKAENRYIPKDQRCKNAAGSRALIIYFAKMAKNKKGGKQTVDYRFLESLFLGGAKIDVCDKHGQTILHEVARNWNIDVAKFFIEHHADVNKSDHWGRTPLHLAAAVNHYKMVKYLFERRR